MHLEFFDKSGSAVVYTPDGTNLFLWNGDPVAYLIEGKAYSFKGKFLGWFEDGWLTDLKNVPALFSNGAVGGPLKPVRKVSQAKSVRRVLPVKSVRSVAKVRPVRSLSWSPVSNAAYFNQA